MKSPIILDSSGLISFISHTDSNHETAVAISKLLKENKQQIILPGEIFTETINVYGKKISHGSALNAADLILSSDEFAIVETIPEVRASALEKFRQQPKSVSFTDCLVMALADYYQTDQIFGFDEVFKKNKYILPS